MPRVFIIPEETPNAFATGRNEKHAVVAVTEGIMRILNKEELEGVIAHELSHIKHKDMLIGSIAATIAGAISMLASMAQWAAIFGGGSSSDDDDHGGIIGLIAMAIIAPIAATVIQMSISRSREYLADAGAAGITKNPYGLAAALEKLTRAFTNCSHGRQSVHGPYVYRQSTFGESIYESFQHASSPWKKELPVCAV